MTLCPISIPNSSIQEIFAKDARLTVVPSISHGDTIATGVNVPFFISNGEMIRIDTRTNSYLDRA